MTVHETLCEIAQQVEINGSCVGLVDQVEELAGRIPLYGLRICLKPKTGSHLVRVNRLGEKRRTNWHEAWYFEEDPGFIVDPDSPDKVYPMERYPRECFENPDNVLIELVEET